MAEPPEEHQDADDPAAPAVAEQGDAVPTVAEQSDAVPAARAISGKWVLLAALVLLGGVMALWLSAGQIRRPPRKPPPSVVAETILVTDAQRAREAGNPSVALQALELHEQRYPSGALQELREVERFRALCALGRVDDARRLAAGFVGRFHGSEHRAELDQGCPAHPPRPRERAE